MKNKSKNKEPENLLLLQSCHLGLPHLSPQPSSGLLSPTTPSGWFITRLHFVCKFLHPAGLWLGPPPCIVRRFFVFMSVASVSFSQFIIAADCWLPGHGCLLHGSCSFHSALRNSNTKIVNLNLRPLNEWISVNWIMLNQRLFPLKVVDNSYCFGWLVMDLWTTFNDDDARWFCQTSVTQ